MTLLISDSMTVAEIKADFNKLFPYLKLVFTGNKRDRISKSSARNPVPDEALLGSITGKNIHSTLEFTENSTVEEFEKRFFELSGIAIQVYRRSGNIWLETNMTDKWSLRMQNEHGREITEI